MRQTNTFMAKASTSRMAMWRGLMFCGAMACSQLAWADIGNMTRLYSFSMTDGGVPQGTLIQGKDGNFYGTTSQGGTSNEGTVFQMTPAGVLTVLHNFDGADGTAPTFGLVQGADGTLYGTTGGALGDQYGYLFSITADGTYNILYAFDSTVGAPSGIILGTDGNFYGTAAGGGSSGYGTVFKLTPAGTLTVLHSFNQADGASPVAPLVQGSDGNFYGTTAYGGSSSGSGTVFKITPDGTLTTLHAFSYTDGAQPDNALLAASDGNFYGTTSEGGQLGLAYGSLFRITPQGDFTMMHAFNHDDGDMPEGALAQAADGSLYGATETGGTNARGNIYQMTLSGTLTSFYSFTGSTDGAYPAGGLTLGSDGSFYGSTMEGGDQFDGVLFKVSTSPGAPAPRFVEESGTYQYGSYIQLADDDSAATIYYTTDGSTPTHSSPVYTSSIALTQRETIKAMASDNGYDSAVTSARYAVQTSMPYYNLKRTKTGDVVSLIDDTPHASIHYTTDGSVPTDSSPIYNRPFLVTQDTTLQALATRPGFPDSTILVAQITIKHGQ